MKKNIVSILTYAALGLSTLMVSCGGESNSGETNKVTNVASEIAFLRVDISGMTCAVGCAKTIEKMLSETDGVESVEVNFEKEAAFIDYDKAKISEADLIKAISEFKDGSYSAKASDKNCKSDCKKACCAKKEVEKAETTTKKVVKEVEKVGNDIRKSTRTTVKSLNEEANQAVVKGTKAVENVADEATEKIKAAKANAQKNLSTIKKTAVEKELKASKELKSIDSSAKKVINK